MLIRLSRPSGLVIPIEDAMSRLRAADEDEQEVTQMLKAATARYEQRTQRIMLPADFEWRTRDFDCLTVPVVPLRSQVTLAYLDADDVEQTVRLDQFTVEPLDDRGFRVRMKSGFVQPSLSRNDLPVRVEFEAGYDDPDASGSGDDPATAQNMLDIQAILMLTAHWYRSREISSDVELWDVPAAFEDLVAERRIYR